MGIKKALSRCERAQYMYGHTLSFSQTQGNNNDDNNY
jgi:hypothetical protein